MQYGPLDISQQKLLWNTKLNASFIDGQLAYKISGELQSFGLSVVDHIQKILLLNWQELSVSQLSVDHKLNADAGRLTVKAIDIVNDQYTQENNNEQGKLYTGSVTLSNFTMMEGKHFNVDDVKIDDAQYQVVVQKDGTLQLSSVLESMLSSFKNQAIVSGQSERDGAENEEQLRKQNEDDITVAVSTLSVSGNSYFELHDQRFAVPVKEKFIIDKLIVKNIDQSNVEKSTTLNLTSRIGEFSHMQIAGALTPFTEKLSVSLSGELEAISLPSLSSYSEAYLGYQLSTGQYDHKFDINIEKDNIVLKNKLLLRQLTLSAVDPDKSQPIDRVIDVPLEFALDVLRDGDDNDSTKPVKQEGVDSATIEQNIIEIAQLRSTHAKRLFVDKGVESRRVFSCQPRYEPQAVSGVTLSI